MVIRATRACFRISPRRSRACAMIGRLTAGPSSRHARGHRWASLFNGMSSACASTTAFRRCSTRRSPTSATGRCAGASWSTCCRGSSGRAERGGDASARPRAARRLRGRRGGARGDAARDRRAQRCRRTAAVLAAQPVRVAAPVVRRADAERQPRPSRRARRRRRRGARAGDGQARRAGAELRRPSRARDRVQRRHPRRRRSATWSSASSDSQQTAARRRRAAAARPAPRARRRPGDGRLFEWESDASGISPGSRARRAGRWSGGRSAATGSGCSSAQAASRLGQRHPFVDVPLALGEAAGGRRGARPGCPPSSPPTGVSSAIAGSRGATDGAAPRQRAPSARARPRCAARDWSTRSRRHSTRSSASPRSSTANISAPRTAAIASARRASSARRGSCSTRSRISISPPSCAPSAARAGARRRRACRDLFPPIAAELEQCLAAMAACSSSTSTTSAIAARCRPNWPSGCCGGCCCRCAGVVGAGETFRIAVTRRGAMCLLTIARPRRLDGLERGAIGRSRRSTRRTATTAADASGSALRCGWCAGWRGRGRRLVDRRASHHARTARARRPAGAGLRARPCARLSRAARWGL